MPIAFVLGAAGSIGRHCVAELRQRGWTVAGLGHGVVNWTDQTGIDFWLAGDVSTENLDLLGETIGTPQLIINLAGGSSVGASLQAPLGDFQRTVGAGACLFNWAWRNAPGVHLSLASSAAVYGTGHDGPIDEAAPLLPLSPYGHHKVLMEANARFWAYSYGVQSSILRLFSVYGPGLRKQFIHDFLTKVEKVPREIVLSGTGDERRDWLWIGDAARMMIDVGAFATTEVPVFNGCTGRAVPIRDIASQLTRNWGAGTTVRFDGLSRPGDPLHLFGDATALRSRAVTAKVRLEDGLAEVVAEWRRGLIA